MSKQIITWEQFHDDVKVLAQKLKSIKLLAKNIYGVPRGGLIPAVIISHILDIPLITEKRRISKDTIIIDDIVDTGKTLERILKSKKVLCIGSVWYHPKARMKPDFFSRIKETEDWLVFPFETIKSSKYDKTV